MDAQNFTNKSLEAIQEAQTIALGHNNMQIGQAHLLLALLTQRDGLIPQLLKKMGSDTDGLVQGTKSEVEKIPGVTGPGREAGKIYVSQSVDTVLVNAERQAKRMKDEYVSVEHIMLALMDSPEPEISARRNCIL